MEVPFDSIRTAIGPSITRPTGMMQSQALATLVIIRQIDKPACDLGYTPRISRNHGCRSHHSVASQPSSASSESVTACQIARTWSWYLVLASALADRAGLPSLQAFRGEDPVMAARSKPMAFRGCAPLAFRLTVADPNYQRSIWSSRTKRSWPSVSLLMRY